MKTLITPAQVLETAFSDGEILPPSAVSAADIAAAETRWIVPAVGRRLYEKLLVGGYADFRNEYLAAPTALYTRALLQPRLDVRTDRSGTTAPESACGKAADEETRRKLRRQLLLQARTLLARAVDYLDQRPALFPEYEPGAGPAARCSIDGGIVLPRCKTC